jgi:hypothetical protein
MAGRLSAILILGVVAVLPALAQQANSQTRHDTQFLTNHDVVDMLKAGLPPDVVDAKILASACDFDTSPGALKELKQQGVPDPVIAEMVKAPRASQEKARENEVTDTPSPATEREKPNVKECADCKKVMICYVSSRTGGITENWVTRNQSNMLQEKREALASGKAERHFWFVRQKENADFIVFWTRAIGFRPHVYYLPQRETEMDPELESRRGVVGSDYTWGSSSGTVEVTRTYYTREYAERTDVDYALTVFDARTGRKVYETWHRGNTRWSKPDKDCLTDALNFLQSH